MVRASFPFTSRPYKPVLPLTINTVGGGSVDPFPIIDLSTFASRPVELKVVEKVSLHFTTTVSFGADARLILSYFATNGTKIALKVINSGSASSVVFTPPDTGPLLGSGEFPIIEASGSVIDGAVLDVAEIHLGLDR
jgi:hypothetical protein